MLLTIAKFGGILPKIKDPLLLPDGKSQAAVDCRFDHGGVEALLADLFNNTPANVGPLLSLFLYQYAGKFLAWNSDVKAMTAPLANDSFHRVFYTESGTLKVTDSTLYNSGGTAYPEKWYYPSPPAPTHALSAVSSTIPEFNAITSITKDFFDTTTASTRVTEVSGAVAGLTSQNSQLQLKFSGTGIPSIDGKTLSFQYPTVFSGPQESFLLNGLFAMPTGDIQNITQANPGVVTSANHGLTTGDKVHLKIIGLSLLVNYGYECTITRIDANSFSIGIDTTTYTPAFGGGTWTLIARDYSTYYSNVAMSAVTKANPAQVTAANHGLINGTVVTFNTMVGMTQLATVQTTITVADANNFTLDGIDSTAFGTFVSGNFKVTPVFTPVLDRTLIQSRYYVETLVNGYGNEGPPSLASNIVDVFDGDAVAITDTNVTADPNYNIVSKNIYRSNVDAAGNEILQFLVNIPLATGTYSDTTLSAALGEVLQSTEWDGPPAGVEGLTPLANETVAAFSGNLVLFSVPGFPYAWPVSYQKPTDVPVMGLGAFGTSVLVLTQGVPYLVTGNAPSNYVMDKLGVGFGCISKRSVVQVGPAVIYASTDGLAMMGINSATIVTKDIISPDEWRDTYNPTTLSGYLWEEKYVGFYTNGATQAGFYFDPQTGDFVPLDFYATAGYADPVSGALYLVVGGNVVAFARGTTLRTMSVTTKRYRFHPTTFRAAKIIATAYPVTVQVTYYNSDGGTSIVSLTATSRDAFRHPDMDLTEECDVIIQGGVTAIYLASTMQELPV